MILIVFFLFSNCKLQVKRYNKKTDPDKLTLNFKKEATAYTIASFTYINCIFFFLLLQIFSYVLRLVSRNVLFYESPAGYLL